MAEMREVFLRKWRKGVGILGLCGLLLFTGCSKQDALPEASSGENPVSGLELQKLTELTEDFSNQVRTVKETEYQNLIFGEDFLVTAPEAEKVYDLELTRKPALPAEELLQKFDALVDFQWEDVYSDEEKEELYRYWPLGGAIL